MNTYKVLVYCTNCNYDGNIELLKGTPVSDNMECPNCGCKACYKTAVARPRPGKKEQPGILPYHPWVIPTVTPDPFKYERIDNGEPDWNKPVVRFAEITCENKPDPPPSLDMGATIINFMDYHDRH